MHAKEFLDYPLSKEEVVQGFLNIKSDMKRNL